MIENMTDSLNGKSPTPESETSFQLDSLGRHHSTRLREIYRSAGCAHCHHKGYRGRIALMELLFIDSDLDELIARHATMREIRDAAISKGFKTLAEDGVRRVLEGSTSLAEVSRVVDLTGRLR